jgi:Na+-transporting methylmalonyl-CoA/oxaloacetate decarboxylase gamma subunit
MELLQINWGNAFIVVGLGFGMVVLILYILVFLLVLWEKVLRVVSFLKKKPRVTVKNAA